MRLLFLHLVSFNLKFIPRFVCSMPFENFSFLMFRPDFEVGDSWMMGFGGGIPKRTKCLLIIPKPEDWLGFLFFKFHLFHLGEAGNR